MVSVSIPFKICRRIAMTDTVQVGLHHSSGPPSGPSYLYRGSAAKCIVRRSPGMRSVETRLKRRWA